MSLRIMEIGILAILLLSDGTRVQQALDCVTRVGDIQMRRTRLHTAYCGENTCMVRNNEPKLPVTVFSHGLRPRNNFFGSELK